MCFRGDKQTDEWSSLISCRSSSVTVCCGTGDKGLAQPLSSLLEISIFREEEAECSPPAESERLTQFHYPQHKDEVALTTMTPRERVPSPLPSCHCYRGQGTSKVTYGFWWGNDGRKGCPKINVIFPTVCWPVAGVWQCGLLRIDILWTAEAWRFRNLFCNRSAMTCQRRQREFQLLKPNCALHPCHPVALC